jgi:hypothetical protein
MLLKVVPYKYRSKGRINATPLPGKTKQRAQKPPATPVYPVIINSIPGYAQR